MPAGDDELKLKDGSVLRGTVVASIPNKEIVILVGGTGEVRHVPWAEVERVGRGKYAPKPIEPPPSGESWQERGEDNPSFKSSGEIGLFFGVVPGAAGSLANPGVQITPGLSLAAGHTVRYHLTFAFSNLSIALGSSNGSSITGSANGFDLRPLTIGFPIHVHSWESVGLAIEPLVDVIGMQALFGNGNAAYLLSSGFGVQGVFNFRSAYIDLAPLNFQFQYAAFGSAGGGIGFGLNMPVRLSGGLRF